MIRMNRLDRVCRSCARILLLLAAGAVSPGIAAGQTSPPDRFFVNLGGGYQVMSTTFAESHSEPLDGDDPFELRRREQLHDALGRGDGGVLRVPPGRERVRRLVRNDVDLRHRQMGVARQPLRHLVERVLRPDRLRPIHPQHDLVGEPVRADVHDRREDEGDHDAARPAERVSDYQQQSAQRPEQQRSLQSGRHGPVSSLQSDNQVRQEGGTPAEIGNLDVLVEGTDPKKPGYSLGTSCRYATVSFPGHAAALRGRRVTVRAETHGDGKIVGEPVVVVSSPPLTKGGQGG